MVETKKLSLAELKAKAQIIGQKEALESVKGGDWSDCHGCDSAWAKTWDYIKAIGGGPKPALSV